MFKVKYLLNLFLFILVTSLSAQVVQVNNNTLEIGTLQLEEVNKGLDKNVEGSPYISDTFIPAKINAIKKTHFVRLNAIHSTLEVKIATNKIVVLNTKNNFDIQLLDGSRRRYTSVNCTNENGKMVNAILEVISENAKYSLYKKEQKKFIKAKKGGAYTDKESSRYVIAPSIYYLSAIKKGTIKVIEIPSKKKKFFALFDENSEKLNRFVKQEKLSISKSEDLIKILNFHFENKR